MIPRLLENLVLDSLNRREKIHLLLGARQVGKTVFLQLLKEKLEKEGKREILYLNADTDEDRNQIDTTSLTVLKQLLSGSKYLFLDEAQRLSNPGLTLKIIHDLIPSVRVLATGSSSFDLRGKAVETLTGRYVDFILSPFSLCEAVLGQSWEYLLPQILVYGLYPQIFLEPVSTEKRLLLEKIIESYLFKDVLAFGRVRSSQAIMDLAKALAYQIANEVSENELANRLKINRKTVVSYLNILEKAFVIFRLPAFSRNPRREIGRASKIYFWDLGVRNALIGDFNPLDVRSDTGVLWENFLIVERRKKFLNKGQIIESRFWRSYGGAEVDYLEIIDGKISAFEFKYGEGKLSRGTGSFRQEYKIPVSLINRKNFSEFV